MKDVALEESEQRLLKVSIVSFHLSHRVIVHFQGIDKRLERTGQLPDLKIIVEANGDRHIIHVDKELVPTAVACKGDTPKAKYARPMTGGEPQAIGTAAITPEVIEIIHGHPIARG